MPDFSDSFTAREVCEGMLSQVKVHHSLNQEESNASRPVCLECSGRKVKLPFGWSLQIVHFGWPTETGAIEAVSRSAT